MEKSTNQLDIFQEVIKIEIKEKEVEIASKPYRNGMGELLPWEDPDFKN